MWSYALGTPASTHPKYDDAVKVAIAGKWNPWWIRQWQDVEAVLDGCYFDESKAIRILRFCQYIQYPKEDGGGKVKLIDWQVYDFIAPLFGWQRPGGLRRYRRGALWVPKKNGKSFLCSLIALAMLVKPTEPAPEVYVAAGDREQASIVYRESSCLAASSPQIAKRVRRIDSRKRIEMKEGRGMYRVLSSDAKLAEGIKWSCMILDELHVQKPQMWQTVKGGGVSRQEPLMIAISTAGVYDETSIGWEQWRYSQSILSGEVKNWSYFALQYGAQDSDDWTDPLVWQKANPSFGAVLREDSLRELYDEARDNPSEQPNFKRYHLNQWVHSISVWIPKSEWDECNADFDEADLIGQRCYAAMDMSETQDMTALVLWFPERGPDAGYMLEWYWLPNDNLADIGEKNNVPYISWNQRGLLLTTPGNFVDNAALEADVIGILAKYQVEQMAFDPYNAAAMMQAVERFGIDCCSFPQTTRQFNEPMKQFTAAVYHRRIRHRGHDITRWQLGNCQVVYDSGGLMKLNKTDGGGINKRGVRRNKIDGLVAAVMACGIAHHAEENKPGILVL